MAPIRDAQLRTVGGVGRPNTKSTGNHWVGWMSFLRKFAAVSAAVMILVMGPPSTGFALELGLTPSQVFGLWTNINSGVLSCARGLSDDEAWLRHLSELEPRKFSGKTPKDVLEKVKLFEAKFSKLTTGIPLHVEKTNFAKEVTFLLRDDSSVVTPSLVFLNSGRVLVQIAHAVVITSDGKQPISQFFAEHGFQGKVPSDVYGLSDLALRRLDEILMKQQAGLLKGSKAGQ